MSILEPGDSLADVFPDTWDAPMPRWYGAWGPEHGGAPYLLPARTDLRWAPRPLAVAQYEVEAR